MAVVHITSPVAPVKAKSAGRLVVSLSESDIWDYGATAKVKITDSAGNTVWSGTQGFTKGESSLSLRYPEVTGVYQINVQCISITGGVRAEVNQSLTVEP